MGIYRPRLIDQKLKELTSNFPAVMINGARAIGKTTTAGQYVKEIAQLDIPGTAAAFRADPDAAIQRYGRPLLIDEWQEVPEIMGAIKRAVDLDSTPNQFILTGSNNFSIADKTWPGTGRIIREKMYGLSRREIENPNSLMKLGLLEKIISSSFAEITVPKKSPTINDYVEMALQGGFPYLNFNKGSNEKRGIWLESYINELVTKDVGTISERRNSEKIRKFLTVNAIQSGTITSDSTLYDLVKINSKTASDYDDILISLGILEMLPSWSDNLLKHIALTPKRYLLDTSILGRLSELDSNSIINDDKLLGNVFDTFSVAQIRPEVFHSLKSATMFHLRTAGGRHEVDLVVKLENNRLLAFEFKAGASPTISDAKHLVWLKEEIGKRLIAGVVLHTGSSIYQLGDRIYAIPLSSFWA